jgi:hypothetical protein
MAPGMKGDSLGNGGEKRALDWSVEKNVCHKSYQTAMAVPAWNGGGGSEGGAQQIRRSFAGQGSLVSFPLN